MTAEPELMSDGSMWVIDPLQEIITDTADEDLVEPILRRIRGLVVEETRRSAPLGLTRWTVAGELAELAARLRHEHSDLPQPPRASQQQELDLVLAFVRAEIRETAPSRAVVVERDHDILLNSLNPHVKGGATDPPVPFEPHPDDRVPAGAPDGPVVGVADAQMGQHEDLAGRYLGWPDPLGTPRPQALAHSTFVAGTVLTHAPGARLLCRPVLQHGVKVNRSWEVAERLLEFLDDDIAVLNMSFGCQTDTDVAPYPLRRAIERLSAHTVLVASGGNEPDPKPSFPVAIEGVLGVGAVDEQGKDGSITPTGPWVDVYAPGIDVRGPVPTDLTLEDGPKPSADLRFAKGYARWSGSSFATAYVTGEIARLASLPGMDPWAARQRVLAGAVPAIVPAPRPS